jgi:hypothetical protein
MAKFQVTVSEHRLYKVYYTVEAESEDDAKEAVETGDDSYGEVLDEDLGLVDVLQMTVGEACEIADT